jgi:hypothetical protein
LAQRIAIAGSYYDCRVRLPYIISPGEDGGVVNVSQHFIPVVYRGFDIQHHLPGLPVRIFYGNRYLRFIPACTEEIQGGCMTYPSACRGTT